MAITINPGTIINPGVSIVAPALTIDTSGLQLYLDAGNPLSYPGSGDAWTDTIGSKVFTLINGPTYSSNNGGYIQFITNPGTSQYAYCGTPLPTLSNWSIEVWLYHEGTLGDGACIFTERYGGGTINLTLGSPLIRNTLTPSWFDGYFRQVTPYSPATGAWYHIVGTYDGTNLTLYVNGNQVRSDNVGGPAPPAGTHGFNLMARWDNEVSDAWGGKLSIVRVYNRDIGQIGVTRNFNVEHTRFGL